MTRIWSVNADNDIFVTPAGRLAIGNDLQAVIQQCEHAIKAQTGEMIYAADRGVDTERSLWDGSPNLLQFEAFARTALNRIPDVIRIESFESRLVGHTLQYSATIRTVFGTGTIGTTSG